MPSITSSYSQHQTAVQSQRYRVFSSIRDENQTGSSSSSLDYARLPPPTTYWRGSSGPKADERHDVISPTCSMLPPSYRVPPVTVDVTRINHDVIENNDKMEANVREEISRRQLGHHAGENIMLARRRRLGVDEGDDDLYRRCHQPTTTIQAEMRANTDETHHVMRLTGSNRNGQSTSPSSYIEHRPSAPPVFTVGGLYAGIASPAVNNRSQLVSSSSFEPRAASGPIDGAVFPPPNCHRTPSSHQLSTGSDTEMMMMRMMRREHFDHHHQQQQQQQEQEQQRWRHHVEQYQRQYCGEVRQIHRQKLLERPPVYLVESHISPSDAEQFVAPSALPPPTQAVDDVLFREAAEYVIASRTVPTAASSGASFELAEFLRSVNFDGCRDPTSGCLDLMAVAERHQQRFGEPVGHLRPANSPSPTQRPVGDQAVVENSPTPGRWVAAGGSDTVSDVGGMSDKDCRDVTNRRTASGLWIGTPKKTRVRRRIVATRNESYLEDGNWCSACFRHVTSFHQSSEADGRVYHNQCLNCCICQRSLENKPFYSSAGSIYCENDYLYIGFQRNVETCSACCNAIGDVKLEAMGKSYHPDCFQCTVCGDSLDESLFTVDIKGRCYCIPDYCRLYSPKCCVCHQNVVPANDKEVTIRCVALDKNYHLSCFRCVDCGTHLSDGHKSFCYPLNNQPYCLTCRGRRIHRLSAASEGSSAASLPPHQLSLPRPPGAFRSTTSDEGSYNIHDVTATSSPSFPVVDATIDDDQASWASSGGGEVAMAIRGQPPVRRHHSVLQQQQQPTALTTSDDTSSGASSLEHEYDVSGRTSEDLRLSLDGRRDVKSCVIVEDERRLRQIDERGDDENDNGDEEAGTGSESVASSSSSCAGGADSGHCSSPSDDTLTSSSEAEVVKRKASPSGLVALSSSINVDAVVGEWKDSPRFSRHSSVPEIIADDDELSVVPEADLVTSSACKNVAELIARQLNCFDLESCRVTDL